MTASILVTVTVLAYFDSVDLIAVALVCFFTGLIVGKLS